jgi:LacI family transcriptional regulator
MNENNSRSKSQNVTIFDIAREAGVSTSTVSRVLSGYETIKESTRERVIEAANRLGYVANPQARSLARARTQTVAVLLPNLDSGYGYIGEVMRGIELELDRADYNVTLYTTRRHLGKELAYVKSIANGLADGLLLVVPANASDYLDALRGRNFPYVLIDQGDSSGKSSIVDSTNWQGAYDATRFLIELGHRRIGFITGQMEIQSAVDRLEGYKAALTHYDIPFIEELIVQGDFFELAKNNERGFDLAAPSQRYDAILVDIEHSPDALLDE